MKPPRDFRQTDPAYTLITETFAARNGVKPQSIRARVCRTGSYFGVTPRHLANGRLLWPNVQVAV
jgi:hypothetical protein